MKETLAALDSALRHEPGATQLWRYIEDMLSLAAAPGDIRDWEHLSPDLKQTLVRHHAEISAVGSSAANKQVEERYHSRERREQGTPFEVISPEVQKLEQMLMSTFGTRHQLRVLLMNALDTPDHLVVRFRLDADWNDMPAGDYCAFIFGGDGRDEDHLNLYYTGVVDEDGEFVFRTPTPDDECMSAPVGQLRGVHHLPALLDSIPDLKCNTSDYVEWSILPGHRFGE